MRCPTRSSHVFALVLIHATAAAQSFNGRSASEWVGDLSSTDVATRDRAVASLVIMGERAVRPTLRALDDERAAVRRLAALVLGRLGAIAAPAREKLLALRQDSDPEVAHAAVVAALRVHVDAAALPQVIEALRGKDWESQLAAADVAAQLGKLAAPAAAALVEVLRREDRALDRTDVTKAQGLQTEYRNVRQSAARALGAIGPVDGVPIVAALVGAAQNTEWAAREGAAEALGSFPGDEQAETCVLTLLVSDGEWPVGRAAAASLPKLFGPDHARLAKAVKAAALALQDKDGGVRRLAAEFLGGCGAGAASAVPQLVRLLATKQNREYGLAALRRLGPVAAEAKDALIACHEAIPADEEWRRREVLEALAATAPEARRDFPPLEQLFAEREKEARPADVKRQEKVVAGLAALQAEDAKVRMRALVELAELRATEAVPHLVEWLGDDRPPAERAAAIHALIALDAARIVPRMRELLAARQPEVRSAAAQALAMFDDTESLPRVAQVLGAGIALANSDQLVYFGVTQVAALAPQLERIVANAREPMRRRWGATQALGYLRAPTSAAVIAAMLDEVAKDDAMPAAERDQLLAVGLTTLLRLDPAPHRDLFARHAASDALEVRNVALAGLARLGDEKARAEARRSAAWTSWELELDDAWRRRLEASHLRLSQVKGNTLRDVLALLAKQLGVRIELSPQVAASALDHRFGTGYIELIGFRPDALAVLGVCTSAFFSGVDLEPRFADDRIELVPAKDMAPTKR